jgi:hypothetical protein
MRSLIFAFYFFSAGAVSFGSAHAAPDCDLPMGSGIGGGGLVSWMREVQDRDVNAAIEKLRACGFECLDERHDPESARRCVGKIPGYSKKVAIYIPIHYRMNETSPTLITHFHGHVVENDDFVGTLNRYHLGTELHRSGLNRLMIVPESTGKCETYLSELSTRARFEEFQQGVLGVLKTSGLVGREVDPAAVHYQITGHSGAYRPISGILQDSLQDERIERVGLFDATYCSTPESRSCLGLREYANRFPGRIKSYYLEDSPTSKGSEMIFRQEDRVKLSRKDYSHFTVMNGNYADWMRE